MTAAGDLDGLVARVDPDRWLASRFIADAEARADVVALYAYDHELARATKVASNELLAEIRLTWWREVLDQVFADGPVRRHPTAEALAGVVRRRGLARAPLEAMIDGRIEALGPTALDAEASVRWANAVGGSAAVLAASILGAGVLAEAAGPAGRAFGLALVGRAGLADRGTLATPLRAALGEARKESKKLGVAAFPAALPARLARFDLAGRAPGPLAKRLALVFAMVTAHI